MRYADNRAAVPTDFADAMRRVLDVEPDGTPPTPPPPLPSRGGTGGAGGFRRSEATNETPPTSDEGGSPRNETPPTSELGGSPRATALLSLIRSGAERNGWEPPEPEWLVPGIVPYGYSILGAPPKAGKTHLANDISLALAAGGTAIGGIDVEQTPVLLLAMEDTEGSLIRRARKITGTDNLPPQWRYLTREHRGELVQPGVFADLLRMYREKHGCGLVVMDTVARLRPPQQGRNLADEDYAFGAWLADFAAREGIAIWGLWHVPKGSANEDDPIQAIAGTYGVTAPAEATASLKRNEQGTEGVLRGVSREGAPYELGLKNVGGCWQVIEGVPDVDGWDGRRTERTRDLLAAARAAGEISRAITVELYDGNEKAADKALDRLVKRGQLRRGRHGFYHPTEAR